MAVKKVNKKVGVKKRPHLKDTEDWLSNLIKDIGLGKKPVEYNNFLLKGVITAGLKSKLTKNINELIKNCDKYKIGKSGDTYVRADYEDYRSTYKKMYVLYKSTSEIKVSALEVECIEKFLKLKDNKTQNKRANAPGRGMVSHTNTYYLYLVTN